MVASKHKKIVRWTIPVLPGFSIILKTFLYLSTDTIR